MAQGKAFAGSNQLGFPITLPSGEVAYAQAFVQVDAITGTAIGAGSAAATAVREQDTDGNPVPIYKPHAFTYDNSGNLASDTVSDGTNTWVRSYTYTPTGPATDSGWVKQ